MSYVQAEQLATEVAHVVTGTHPYHVERTTLGPAILWVAINRGISPADVEGAVDLVSI